MSIKNNYPTIRPSLDLNFAGSKVVDPRVTFTRPSTATYYDGKTVAKAEENLLKYSQEFDNASWTKSNSTVTANSTTAPDGTATAETITATTGGGIVPFVAATSVGVGVASVSYVYSAFIKAGTHSFVQFRHSTGTPWHVNFDIAAGVVGTSSNCTASIQTVGNGWYRCVTAFTPSTTNCGAVVAIEPSASATNFQSWNPTGAETIYIWGAQLEQRAQATAYTPTTDQPITRYQPALMTAAANTPRIDHDPITGECKGLLIEESRTNLLTYSSGFDNAAWTKGNVAVQADVVVAPDGTLTGDKFAEDSANSTHFISVATLSVSNATAYTFSCYVKAAGRTWFRLADTSFADANAFFNLSSGIVGSVGAAVTSSSITSVGNGWYRCSITYTSTSTSSTVRINVASADGYITYLGDGYSGIYVWGAQLEVGAFPTSYIPTTSAQVTRAADNAYLPISSWYSFGGEGSFLYDFVQGLPVSSQDANAIYFGLFGSSALVSGNDCGFTLYAGNSYLSRNPTSTLPSVGSGVGRTKIALAMDSLGKYAIKNGSAVVSNEASNLNNVVGPTHFSLSGSIGSKHHHHVRRVTYYPKRLPNAQLQALTM